MGVGTTGGHNVVGPVGLIKENTVRHTTGPVCSVTGSVDDWYVWIGGAELFSNVPAGQGARKLDVREHDIDAKARRQARYRVFSVLDSITS
jgi:hypothetical protein